jgi:hypothetical protein
MSTITKGLINRGDLALYDGINSTVSRIDSTGGTITELPIGNVVDVLAVYGADNTATNRATIANAIARIGSATVTFVFSPGTWTIASNLTIPENIAVLVYPGAVFSIDSGITLTINGPLLVGNHKVFEGAGSVSTVASGALAHGINVKLFGAKGDSSTDNITALNNARTMARANKAPVYVPASPGAYYLGSAYLMAEDRDSLVGDGMYETVFYVNYAGVGIKATGQGWSLKGFAVMGRATSTDGIQIGDYAVTGASGGSRGYAQDVWAGDVGRYAFYINNAMSSNFYNCGCFNNGFHPRSIVDIGSEDYHFYLGDGINNNVRFYGCFSDGGGSLGGVRIGNGAGQVQDVQWVGGITQGNLARFLYIQGGEAVHFSGTHMEEAQDGTSWGITLDSCTGCHIHDIYMTGDIRLINGSSLNVIENIHVCSAVYLDSSCEQGNIIRSVWYGANASGPGGGTIKDDSGLAKIEDCKQNNTAHMFVGDGSHSTRQVVYSTNMDDWHTVPSLMPSGFVSNSSVTVTKEATIKKTGTYSMKCVSAAGGNYVGFFVPNFGGQLNGSRVTLACNIYNVTTPSLCTIHALTSAGTMTQGGAAWRADAWTRMLFTINFPATGEIEYRFQFGQAGTFYINDIVLMTDGAYEPVKGMVLDTIAIPEIYYSNSCYQPPFLDVGAGTAITDFKRPHVGKPVTLIFTGSRTVVHGATIELDGSVNFDGVAGDHLTLYYNGVDNKFYEIGRRVVSASQTYTVTNALTDRSYDANATSVDELADVLGTLIADLRAKKIVV